MKSELTLIPSATIHPNKIATYYQVHWSPFKPERNQSSLNFQEANAHFAHLLDSARSAKGLVSPIAKRKINKAIDYLLFLSDSKKVHNVYSGRQFSFKIAFVTLTLPSKQLHSDNEIKSKCLNQLLIELKKYYHVKNYIWRAELQRNENIHFHILLDKFIPYQELRDRWNRIINKLEYVDNYRNNMQAFFKEGFKLRTNLLPTWSAEKQRAAYTRGSRTHWSSPNTTDIHAIKNVHNIKQYVSKYMAKNKEQNQETNEPKAEYKTQGGRIWGCNLELSKIKGAQIVVDNAIQKEIEKIENHNSTKTYNQQYFSVISFDTNLLIKLNCPLLLKAFTSYISHQFFKEISLEF